MYYDIISLSSEFLLFASACETLNNLIIFLIIFYSFFDYRLNKNHVAQECELTIITAKS